MSYSTEIKVREAEGAEGDRCQCTFTAFFEPQEKNNTHGYKAALQHTLCDMEDGLFSKIMRICCEDAKQMVNERN